MSESNQNSFWSTTTLNDLEIWTDDFYEAKHLVEAFKNFLIKTYWLVLEHHVAACSPIKIRHQILLHQIEDMAFEILNPGLKFSLDNDFWEL